MHSPVQQVVQIRRLLIWFAVALVAFGVTSSAQNGSPTTFEIIRFLEQATWGPTPELIEHVRHVGFKGFL